MFANPTSECPIQYRIESESVPLQCSIFTPLPSKATPQVKYHQSIQNPVDGQDLAVYHDGSNVREWIYVEDNCRAVDLAFREGVVGEAYNIGSHAEKTNLEVTEAMLDAVEADDDLIKFVKDRTGHNQHYALKTEKIEALSWKPDYSFEEGLERTVKHYLH